MRIRPKFACGLVLLASFVPALLGQIPSKQVTAAPSAPGQPPASQRLISTPAETPATPPQVTFRDGLLSIRAENSTLGDVLRAVQSATGATIESPGLTSERVYVKLGPGEPRDVLASLLNGSHYDYILLGSRQQPNAVARVILTTRNTSAQPAANTTAARSTPPEPPPQANNDDTDTSESTPDRAAPPPVQPNQQPPGQPPQQQNAQDANQPQTGPKTPEQLLRDLQTLRQQQQQQFQLQQQLQQQNNFSH